MGKTIELAQLKGKGREHNTQIKTYGMDTAKTAKAFHKTFAQYKETPLVQLNKLALYLGVKDIYVKDESARFGLNAFKGLGGSYCVGKYVAKQLGVDIENLSYEHIKAEKSKLGDITFVTATDGNHGRGIAWTANVLGFQSVVYMPKGSAVARLENIKAMGAKAFITDMNYDDTVRYAARQAEKNNWVLVQDTAWEGYTEIPRWIMQGYTTMGLETVEQLGEITPTHIFLQAGVGAMAGAIAAFFTDTYADKPPIITIAEPNKADCIYKTAAANDGKLHTVSGDLDTIMAGLACGEPCTIGWDILKDCAHNFVSMPDSIAAKGMRVLGNPLEGDKRVISGESGAATLGLVAEVLQKKQLEWLKNKLQLDENAVVLCISTEGDTDQKHYRKVVWDGIHPSV